MIRLRLIHKITIPFISIVLLVFILLTPVVISISMKTVEDKMYEGLHSFSASVLELIENERKNLQRDLKLLFDIPLIEKALLEKDRMTLTRVLLPVKQSLKLDFIAALDDEKGTILSFAEPGVNYLDVLNSRLVEKGLYGLNYSSIMLTDTEIYNVSVVPSTVSDKTYMIIGGKAVSKDTFASVHEHYKSAEVLFYNPGGRAVFTTSDADSVLEMHDSVSTVALETVTSERKMIVEKVKDKPHVILFGPMIINGELQALFGAHMDISETLTARRYIAASIILFMLGGIGCIIAAAYFTSKRIAERVHNILMGTKEVAKGNLDCRIIDKCSDELSEVAASFNQMNDGLSNSWMWWQRTFDSMSDGVSILDRDLNIEKTNASLASLLGCDQNELIGKNLHEVLNDCEPSLKEGPSEKCLMSREPENMEVYDKARKRWLLISVSPVIDDEGALVKMIHVVNDITDRKAIEEMIDHAKREWEMIFDSANEMIALIDCNYSVLRCNRSFADFVNKDIHKVTGKSLVNLIPAESLSRDVGFVDRKIEVQTENDKWLYVSSCPIYSEDGEVTKSVVVCTDITALKRTQEMLGQSEEKLKEKVDDLERFYDFAVNRELKMKELKNEIRSLRDKLEHNNGKVSSA